MQEPDGVHNVVGIELGELVVRVVLADAELERLGLALGEMEALASLEEEEAAVGFCLFREQVGQAS